jgi:hypothetical protein
VSSTIVSGKVNVNASDGASYHPATGRFTTRVTTGNRGVATPSWRSSTASVSCTSSASSKPPTVATSFEPG